MKRENLDYASMLREHGYEFLSEHYSDYCPYPMDELEELTQYGALEAITRAFYGYAWNRADNHNEPFNPNSDYFAFNGYGNLVSIEAYYYDDYLNSWIDEGEFITWCDDNGYLEDYYEEDSEE